jgi:hypothetical protein
MLPSPRTGPVALYSQLALLLVTLTSTRQLDSELMLPLYNLLRLKPAPLCHKALLSLCPPPPPKPSQSSYMACSLLALGLLHLGLHVLGCRCGGPLLGVLLAALQVGHILLDVADPPVQVLDVL